MPAPGPGTLHLIPLADDRFGGLQVVSCTDDEAQVALLDVIWDCRPAPDAVAAAQATVQLRVPRARLIGSIVIGRAAPPPQASVARVDAPLTALIAGLIATA